MITFNLHINNNLVSFNFKPESKIISLKNYIITNYYPKDKNTKYIDLEYVGDAIIRGFGKLTLEKGIISRHMDDQKLERYNLDGKTIELVSREVSDYIYKQKNNKKFNSNNISGYIPPHIRKKANKNKYVYNEADFPPLGS